MADLAVGKADPGRLWALEDGRHRRLSLPLWRGAWRGLGGVELGRFRVPLTDARSGHLARIVRRRRPRCLIASDGQAGGCRRPEAGKRQTTRALPPISARHFSSPEWAQKGWLSWWSFLGRRMVGGSSRWLSSGRQWAGSHRVRRPLPSSRESSAFRRASFETGCVWWSGAGRRRWRRART